MKKRAISMLLVLCLVFSFGAMQVSAADTYGNFEGSGTSSDPFLIQSEQDFYTLIDSTNEGTDMAKYYVGADGIAKYFKVTKDLDMKNYPVNGHGIGITGSWGLLGIKSHFDGNNRTISNLSITDKCDMMGVFGQLQGGSIQNFVFDQLSVTSTHAFKYTGYAGLLIASVSSGKISHCTIKNSTIDLGTPEGSVDLGGICGNNNGAGFDNCYTYNNTFIYSGSNVTKFGTMVGGKVGSMYHCYTDAQPIASDLTRSIAYTTVNNYNVGEHGKLLEKKNGTDITREVNGASVVEALDHYYTVVPDEGYGYTVKVNGNIVPTDENNQFKVVPAALNTIDVTFFTKPVEDDPYKAFAGSGTSDDPFLIQSEQDFYNLIDKTNEDTDVAKYYVGADGTPKYFKVTKDLDMKDLPMAGTGIGIIGSWGLLEIKSHFDGDGHTISNLAFSNKCDMLGVFGQVVGGSVKNFVFDNLSITSTSAFSYGGYVGLLVADTRNNGKVSGCTVKNSKLDIGAPGSNITVGGIVGNSNGIGISNCFTYNNTYPDFTGQKVTFGSMLGGSIASSITCYTDMQPIASNITPSVAYTTVNNYNVGEHGKLLEKKKGTDITREVNGASVVEALDHYYTVVPDEGYTYTVTVNGNEVTPDENNQFTVYPAKLNTINVTFTQIPQTVSNTIEAGEGTVTINGTDYTGTQIIENLTTGTTLNFTVTPPANKLVQNISYNGQDLGDKVDYVTIVKDATLKVTYRDNPATATPAIVIYDKKPLNTEPTDEQPYSTHTVYAQITGWTLVSDYGMKLTNDAGDSVELPGLFTAEVLNSLEKCEGKFAVKVYGDGIVGRTCTITPYFVFNQQTTYGETSEEFTGK